MGQVHWSSTIGVDKYYSGHQSSFQKHFHTAWAVAWQLWLPSGIMQSAKDSSQRRNGRHRSSICTQEVVYTGTKE